MTYTFPMTNGEILDTAARIAKADDKFEAARLVDAYTTWLETNHSVPGETRSRPEARAIALSNIGYMAGYCDHDGMNQILNVFRAEHPVFGASAPW